VLATILVLGTEYPGLQVAREAPKRNTEKISFQATNRASEQSDFNGKDQLMKQIDDRWVIAVNRVAPSIAQKFSRK
jgi:hypothetical protein